MRQLNGADTQSFNRRYRKGGHLFQGRHKAVLVQNGGYLLAHGRYVVLNPVRVRMVDVPEGWFWSSYRAALRLETDWLLAQPEAASPVAWGERRYLHRASRNWYVVWQ